MTEGLQDPGPNPWISPLRRVPDARLRLICVPYAGAGGGAFGEWVKRFPPSIEVCPIELPGRWTRRQEPLLSELPLLVEKLGQALLPEVKSPYAFFGYSVGATIAFELTRWLRRRQLPGPQKLIVAARRAPQLVPAVLPPHLHLMSDNAAFLKAVGDRYGGVSPVLLADPDVCDMLAPIMRADLAMLERYVYVHEEPLACPMVAISGEQDPTTTLPDLEAWASQTTAEFRMQLFPGGHLFIESARQVLGDFVSGALAPLYSTSHNPR